MGLDKKYCVSHVTEDQSILIITPLEAVSLKAITETFCFVVYLPIHKLHAALHSSSREKKKTILICIVTQQRCSMPSSG
jgi:hypothetical protein